MVLEARRDLMQMGSIGVATDRGMMNLTKELRCRISHCIGGLDTTKLNVTSDPCAGQ